MQIQSLPFNRIDAYSRILIKVMTHFYILGTTRKLSSTDFEIKNRRELWIIIAVDVKLKYKTFDPNMLLTRNASLSYSLRMLIQFSTTAENLELDKYSSKDADMLQNALVCEAKSYSLKILGTRECNRRSARFRVARRYPALIYLFTSAPAYWFIRKKAHRAVPEVVGVCKNGGRDARRPETNKARYRRQMSKAKLAQVYVYVCGRARARMCIARVHMWAHFAWGTSHKF